MSVTIKQDPTKSQRTPAASDARGIGALFRWLSSPLNLILTLCSIIPLLIVLWFVVDRGSNTPVMDQFEDSVIIAIKAAEGDLTFSDLVRQNFDHRLFFTNLITAILTYTSNWNIMYEMYLTIAVVLAIFVLLVLLVRDQEPGAVVFVLVPFSALLFALRHNSLWLWTILIGVPLAVMFLLSGLYILKRHRVGWIPFAGAAFFAVCMTMTQLHGLVGWVLLAFAMWTRGYRKWYFYAAWAAIFAVTLGLYLTNYDFSSLGANEEGNGAGLVRDPLKIMLYCIAYLGNPFVPQSGAFWIHSLVIGTVGILLFLGMSLYLWRKDRRMANLGIWWAVAGFAFGSAVLTALGRAHVFPQLSPVQPLLDRYVLPPLTLWMSVIAMSVIVVRHVIQHRDRTWGAVLLMRASLVTAVVLAGAYLLVNLNMLERAPVVLESQEECVLNFPASRNAKCLAFLYLKQSLLVDVLSRIDSLAMNQLAGFAGRTPIFDEIIYFYDDDHVERTVLEAQPETGFRYVSQNERYESVAFTQTAPSRVAFELDIPDTDQRIAMITAVFVDRTNIPADAVVDGVDFRLVLRDEQGETHELAVITYDPTVDEGMKPIRLNMDAYRGQRVLVLFQTLNRENPDHDYGVWVDPVVIVRHPEPAQ